MEEKKITIGGQAVIEGVMMRGIDKAAMSVRLPDGVWGDRYRQPFDETYHRV